MKHTSDTSVVLSLDVRFLLERDPQIKERILLKWLAEYFKL